MKILVTGGCGFIGNNFIRYWLKNNPSDTLINLDKLTYAGHLTSTNDFKDNPNYEFIKGDICDAKVVAKAMKDADIVVNFAAETHVDRSIVEPDAFIKTNIFGTYTLLKEALDHGIKKFHHVSTDEVFGSLDLGSDDKFSENTNYDPRSPYSASKAASDHIVRSYFHTYGLPITITNCSNNYGPFMDTEKFIPRMVTNLIDGNPLQIYGDGLNVRDWLYVEDHVRAIELVLKKGVTGETYLVGGMTKDVSNLEIAKRLLKIFGKGEDMIKFVADRKGHDRRYAVSWKKINSKLGWSPKYSIDKWLEITVKWYVENEWWWRPLKEESEKLYKKTGQV